MMSSDLIAETDLEVAEILPEEDDGSVAKETILELTYDGQKAG